MYQISISESIFIKAVVVYYEEIRHLRNSRRLELTLMKPVEFQNSKPKAASLHSKNIKIDIFPLFLKSLIATCGKQSILRKQKHQRSISS